MPSSPGRWWSSRRHRPIPRWSKARCSPSWAAAGERPRLPRGAPRSARARAVREVGEGTVLTGVGGGGRKATVPLRVSEVWKGPEQQIVRFATPVADGVSCAHPFEEGREYLGYANGGQDLQVGGCSETKMLSGADADLALLEIG